MLKHRMIMAIPLMGMGLLLAACGGELPTATPKPNPIVSSIIVKVSESFHYTDIDGISTVNCTVESIDSPTLRCKGKGFNEPRVAIRCASIYGEWAFTNGQSCQSAWLWATQNIAQSQLVVISTKQSLFSE